MNDVRDVRSVDQLSVFAALWGAATLSHHLAFPRWFDHHPALNVALVAVAVLVVARPRSILFLTVLACLGVVNVVQLAPGHPNHMLFEGICDAIIICAVLLGWRQTRANATRSWNPSSRERQQLFDRLAAPMRVGALLLYGYAVLHKLNWDFFDADVSCGGAVLHDVLGRTRLSSLPAWAREAGIWGSLLVEIAIPIGLIFRRTRAPAVVLALLFHLLLAQHPITGLYSFSATMLAVLFLFTPPELTEAIGERLARARRAARHRPALTAVIVAVSLAWVLFAIADGQTSRRSLWNVWALGAMGAYVSWAWTARTSVGIDGLLRVRPAVLWMFPLLVLINGASPYLGLKTHASFSMFSNLRTEGGRTNHLFLGRWPLATWQDDLVEIIDSDLPAFARMRDERVLVTHFRFRELAGTASRDFGVTYRRNGESRVLAVRNGVADDPAAATPPPWWQRKLLRFRDVDREGPARCRN